MANVLFVTEDYLKQYSPINGNVDMELMTPYLLSIEDMQIQPIIGTGLFEELKTQVVANTVTALNVTLLDLIRKCMVWYFMAEAPLALTFRYMDKGVMKKSSENSEPISTEDINYLMDINKNKAEWYAERIRLYLCENSTSYPLFSNAGNGADTIHPNRTNYSSGMNLDRIDIPKGMDIDYGDYNQYI